MRVTIIGAGAAGCFCAVELKRRLQEADVLLLERHTRPMAKLAVTGGGRCNLTNSFRHVTDLSQAYPRGWRLMQRLFHDFCHTDTIRWWEAEGVRLVEQPDDCIFPQSQDAGEVVRCLMRNITRLGITLRTESKVTSIVPTADGRYRVETEDDSILTDHVVVTTGGSPRPSGLSFLDGLALKTVQPVPSLFALNIDDHALHSLTGTVVPHCRIAIAGTRLSAEGDLLITHFGMSGPAILRLSSYAARHLAEHEYRATLIVNWMLGHDENQVRSQLQDFALAGKSVANLRPLHLTSRHWYMLLQRANISLTQRWNSLNTKESNRLIATLTADTYHTLGHRTHKEEFVTCGGVALSELNPSTLALKHHPHVHLAGEVLDIDGITGGFNLQAAWTMGHTVAKAIANNSNFLSPTE